MDAVLKEFDLERKDLDFVCSPTIRASIAGELIGDWYPVGRELDVSIRRLDSIRQNYAVLPNPEDKAVAALDAWSDEKASEATYLKLAEALYKKNKTRTLEILCENVKENMMKILCESPTRKKRKATRRSEIKVLEDDFYEIHEKLVDELKSERKSVDEILWKLTKFRRHAVKKMYDNTIQKMLPDLEKNDTVNALFRRLNPLFTFIDYELLEHLISEFGSQSLKYDMSSYVCDLKLFKKEATVGDLIDYWPGHRIADEDGYFKRLMTKFEGDPYKYTLEMLDSFRLNYSSALRLSEFISGFILERVKEAMSFYAVWRIPAVIVPYIIEATRHVESSFYVEEGVVMVSLDGELLYPHFTKSLPSAACFPELSKSITKPSSAAMQLQQRRQQWSLPALSLSVIAQRSQSLQLPALHQLQSSSLPLSLADRKLGLYQSQSSSLQPSTGGKLALHIPRSLSLPSSLTDVRPSLYRARSAPSLSGARPALYRPQLSLLTQSQWLSPQSCPTLHLSSSSLVTEKVVREQLSSSPSPHASPTPSDPSIEQQQSLFPSDITNQSIKSTSNKTPPRVPSITYTLLPNLPPSTTYDYDIFIPRSSPSTSYSSNCDVTMISSTTIISYVVLEYCCNITIQTIYPLL